MKQSTDKSVAIPAAAVSILTSLPALHEVHRSESSPLRSQKAHKTAQMTLQGYNFTLICITILSLAPKMDFSSLSFLMA